MARKVSVRVTVNRKALDAISAGVVDGLEAMGQAVLAAAHPPDDDPIGVGLVTTGDYGVWANGRKVAGGATKPRAVRIKQGITLVVGFGFPGRFNEIGTAHQPARPFLTPAMLATIPGAEGFIKPKVREKLAGVK